MKNDLTKKWEATMLLDGLDELNKNECASSLEQVVCLLLGEMNKYMEEIDSKTEQGYFAGTILPIVRRLYDEVPEKMSSTSMKWLMEDFGEYVKRNYSMFKKLEETHDFDGEAELCTLYTHCVANRL